MADRADRGDLVMLSLPMKVRVFLCTRATDMRKSFDGLHGLVLEVLRQDPQSGDLFVFLNRRRDRVKILVWEGDGLAIWYKRLEVGTFAVPAGDGDSVLLSATQLALLLGGIDARDTRPRKRYRPAA
jgi:transposase